MKQETLKNMIQGIKNGSLNWYNPISIQAANEVGIHTHPITHNHNNQGDAFRHAYTSAIITLRYNERIAKGAGDANEQWNRSEGTEHEEWMDQHNNAIGRAIGAEVKDAGGTEEDLKQAVAAALENGELIVTPFDPRRSMEQGATSEAAIKESLELLDQRRLAELAEVQASSASSGDKQVKRTKIQLKYGEYMRQLHKQIEDLHHTEHARQASGKVGEGRTSVHVKAHQRNTQRIPGHHRSWPDGNPANNPALRTL